MAVSVLHSCLHVTVMILIMKEIESFLNGNPMLAYEKARKMD